MTKDEKKRAAAYSRELQTERFILRPITRFEALFAIDGWRRDPDILSGLLYDSRPVPFHKWIKKNILPNNKTRFLYMITPKGADKPIGGHAIHLRGYRSVHNMVALHDHDWWGKGVVVEVRARLMNHYFGAGLVDRFCGTVNARNIASIYNYQRLGYDHVGTWHRHLQEPTTGNVIDLLNFEIFKDKWDQGPWAETKHDG